MADKSPSDLELNALDINSSLEMAVDEENDPMKSSYSQERDLEFWDVSPAPSQQVDVYPTPSPSVDVSPAPSPPVDVSPAPSPRVDRVRDSLLELKRGVAARLLKSSVRIQNLTALKHNLKSLEERFVSAEEQLDYIADELVMKKEEKYVKELIEMRRNGDGMY